MITVTLTREEWDEVIMSIDGDYPTDTAVSKMASQLYSRTLTLNEGDCRALLSLLKSAHFPQAMRLRQCETDSRQEQALADLKVQLLKALE